MDQKITMNKNVREEIVELWKFLLNKNKDENR